MRLEMCCRFVDAVDKDRRRFEEKQAADTAEEELEAAGAHVVAKKSEPLERYKGDISPGTGYARNHKFLIPHELNIAEVGSHCDR
jgi:hypothetical protein